VELGLRSSGLTRQFRPGRIATAWHRPVCVGDVCVGRGGEGGVARPDLEDVAP
jgi:hypothetical protein